MDCAGITNRRRQLARLAATKPLTLETMSLALVQEYPLIHEKELSRGGERPHPVRKPLPHRPSGSFQPGRSPVSQAYWSRTTLMTAKMTCRTMQRTGATLAVRTESSVTWWTEQDIVCAIVAADCFLSDEDVCEDISECVHAECAAFFGREQARQHGVHVVLVVHSFRPKSELETKKRQVHVEQAKKNSTCRTCGRKGHWAGDRVCPNFVGNRSIPGSSTRPWSANWSKDVSKTDKKHTKGKSIAKLALRRPWMMKLVCAPVYVLSLFPDVTLFQGTLLAG